MVLAVVVAASARPVLLAHLTSLTADPVLGTYASVALATVVNKFPHDHLDSLAAGLFTQLENQKEVSSEGLLWLCKALVMRSFRTEETVARLCRLLSDPSAGRAIADQFGILLSQHHILDKRFGCNIRLMYKQHFFDLVLPKLQAAWEVTGATVYLVALARLLPSLPGQVLLAHIAGIAVLVVNALATDNVTLQHSVLLTLKFLFHEAPKALEQHLPPLVLHLERLATQGQSYVVRTLAVECIGELLSLPHEVVYRHAGGLLVALKSACDDAKRPVRRAAQLCRNKWLLAVRL